MNSWHLPAGAAPRTPDLSAATSKISIRDSFRGKTVLITGTSGFLGKVWLAMVLDKLPEIGKLVVLLRKKGLRPASHRFEKIVNESPVFKPLHERFGADLSRYISERVEVVDGDIGQAGFGISPDIAARLHRELDLVVNCAGLVDFDPDVRDAMNTNIDGAVNAVNFVAACDKASLVHVSTCYVAGNRSGRIAEEVVDGYTPKGLHIDPAGEVAAMRAKADEVLAEHSGEAFEKALAESVETKIAERGLDKNSAAVRKNVEKQERERVVRKAMEKLGSSRAAELGWPNTYTWSKSLSEQLMARRAKEIGVRYSILRPAIVESALEFPFPGWNEGFNTAGPLVYLLGTWFRGVPARPKNPFDVIPVDLVCKGILVAAAETMLGVQPQVYQCGTSDLHLFTVDRAVELTVLSHRQHYRENGESLIERALLSRWDGKTVKPDYVFSMGNIRKTAQSVGKLFGRAADVLPKPAKKAAENAQKTVNDADKQLRGIQRMCDLFQPFIHDNQWIFCAQNLVRHHVVEADLAFDMSQIHWRHYWKDVQVPGLRKWSFPQFEGKDIEKFTPAVPFKMLSGKLHAVSTPVAAPAKAAGESPARLAVAS